MLRFISWSNFLISVLIFLLSYWMVILLIFYKRNLVGLFRKTNIQSQADGSAIPPSDDDQFDRCNACASVLKSAIRSTSLDQPSKGVLLNEIRNAMLPFLDFKGTPWQYPIDNLIKHEVLQRCSMKLEEADVENIWND